MAFEATKREWGELYAFFRLLADGKVYAGTPDVKRNESHLLPVAMVQREEHDGTRQYIIEKDWINIKGENIDKRIPREDFDTVAELIKEAKVPLVCAINKKDILTKDEEEDARFFLKSRFPTSPILLTSAEKDEGIDELLIELFKLAPEGELMYDESSYTDQNLEFRISEIIREKTINMLSDELPHTIFVEVSDLEYDDEENKVWIRAFINTERDGQKGIIVGKGGENIKKIRQASFKDIKKIFPGSKLELDLRVKAVAKWRNNQVILDKIFKDMSK